MQPPQYQQQSSQTKYGTQQKAEVQNSRANSSQEEWQIQKNKKFKGILQNNTKKKQSVHIAKRPNVQHMQTSPEGNATHGQIQISPKGNATHVNKQPGINPTNHPAPLDKKAGSVTHNQPKNSIPPTGYIMVQVNGGWKVDQDETLHNNDGDPKIEGLRHVLQECVKVQLIENELSYSTVDTNDTARRDPLVTVTLEAEVEAHSKQKCEWQPPTYGINFGLGK